ncbi:C2 calcium-dependent domain-containing protein 6 [Rattus rattus]|uniref:C2 calcium-dependent domain-containing protein 6 n=1 Tax=Rattus rattus TaxID=10117 RepID=UPI0013F39E51|nr:C2 calcium-dependent domain-containing protein 6 [Rattus rattus]
MELPPPGHRRVSISNPQETSGRVPTTPAAFPNHPSNISSVSSKRSVQSSVYRPSIMSNRSLGPQSLLPNPIIQKSSLNPPGFLQSKSSNVSSVRYADEEGKPLTEKDKDKEKGKGTGTRLLNMLRKTLQGSQSDEMVVANQTQNLIPFGDVVGCLAIHIKSCRQFTQRFIAQQHFNLFMRISVNHIVKCTKIRHLKAVNNEKNLVLKFDEVKYFSVQVPRRQDDERNYIYLELMQDGGDSEKLPYPLGNAESHLYEVIQKGCFTEVMQMMRRNTPICRVEVEFMFSYGNFGYGFSHQLKPLQKVIEPSMFMKITPPPERTDPVTNIITPQRVEYPAFLSPEFNVNIGGPETNQATVVQLEKLREKPRERLERMKEEYKSMNTWIEKADYLRNLINPKLLKKDSKGSVEPSGSNSSVLEELERTTHDIHFRKSEAISNELVDYSDKEGRVIPVLKLLDQNYSEFSLPKSGDSTPPEDVTLPPIHTLQIIEEDEMPRVPNTSELEDRPHEDRKSVIFSSDEELMPKHPSILKINPSLQENRRKMEKSPHFSDVLIIPDKPEELNTNKKGRPSIELRKSWERRPTDVVCSLRKVAFAQKEYAIPVCKAETTEFKPKHQFQKLSRSGLDPFLRNLNSKMPFRKKKDHEDGYRHPSTLSTEILEHEDQDPPYPEHPGSAGSDPIRTENPRPFTVQMGNKKNSLPPDPITATVISDRRNRLLFDSTFDSENNSNTKSIFASDNPVVSLTKLSDSDNKLLTDSSFNTMKPSNRRLSRDSSSNIIKPSDGKLSSAPSSGTTKPSDTKLLSDPSNSKLSRDPSSNGTQLSGSNRLSHNPSINGNKYSHTSDLNKVSRDPSFISTKSSDLNKLSRDPSIISTRSSDPNKLSHDPSFISTKSSDPNKLSHDSSIIPTKLSDPNKLSRDPSIISTKLSDPNKLSHDPSFISTRSSDPNKLPRDPSIISAKSSDPNKFSRDPSIIPTKLSDANKLSRDPSIISTRSSDSNKLSHDSSIISTKLSDPNKLSRDPSFISTKSSDTNKFSRDPSIISTKSSDPNKLSRDPSIVSTKSSDPNKLSHDPSIISTKLSDPSKLSHDPSINARKSSDTSKLSHDPSVISTKALDGNSRLPSGSPVNSDTTTNTAKPPVTKDPAISTVDSSDKQGKLDEWLQNVSLSNVQRASSVTENVNMHRPSSSINFTSDIENLKQSIVLKSILSKNLQDLSDELFSKAEVCTNESCSPPPNVHNRPSDTTDDRVFEKVQDINSWRSSKDLLNSQVLLSPVVKNSPQNLLPEGEPGKSSDIEDYVSEKVLEAAERSFPMNRKSTFKKKHLISEESGSERVLNSSIYEYVIKQIFTAPIFSQLGIGTKSSREAQMDSQDQLLTPWESLRRINYEEKGNEVHLSQSKSVISQIIQSFPVNTLLESGMIKVIELNKEHQNSLLDSQTTSSTEQYSEIKSQIKLISRQNTSSINPSDSSVSGAEYTEDCQSISTQESKYLMPGAKSDSPTDTEETELDSNVESSSSSLDKVKDTDTAMLKSLLKNIFSIFFKYNQSEKRQQPEKESESLIKHSSSSVTEHLEKTQENFNKVDKKLDRKPILNPKLRMFLEKLSETEVKNLKTELSKHIQRYLVERLTESGHITKEDLPTIYHKLYLINEKAELKEQIPFQEKYSDTVKEIMSFVNNFNHHFIDKHLEAKLRAFLSEILQNYFLKNLSVSNLFNETDAMALHASMSPARSKSELGQDIADGNFGPSLKINMKYPVSKSLQNYLQDLSESDLLNLKADLSKYLQVLFLEKLYKSGLMTERQLKGISQEIISLHSPPIPLKHLKTNLAFRNESYFMREDSEEQKKYSKNGQNTALQALLKGKCGETELSRKEEKESSFSQNLKENLPTIWEQKTIYCKEEERLNLIEIRSSLNKNNQAHSLTRSPERPSDISLKKQKKDHGFMQFTQVESSAYKTEIQDPYSWDGRSKTIQSKPCFEKTGQMKQVDKRENNNVYKSTAQEKLDTEFSSYLKLPNCKVSKENESTSRLSFPTWQTNAFIHVKPEIGEQSKLDHYYQRLKGNNNNNKKHLVTFAQFKDEMETLYKNPYEACNEKRAKISESQSFKYKEHEKNSRPFFFPEVLKRENMKSKRKEKDHATKPKKSFHKIVRLLPVTLPTTRPHLRKSVPRNLLHWTARRTIHDCLDRFDDLHAPPSVKCTKKSRSRARLLGKSPDDSHNQAKHCARPYTAPEPNKRRESATWKFASPRMVSAGLVHLYATPEYEIRKMRSKRKLKEDIEKRPLISEIIQMLDTAE